jgi:hypothetical protein
LRLWDAAHQTKKGNVTGRCNCDRVIGKCFSGSGGAWVYTTLDVVLKQKKKDSGLKILTPVVEASNKTNQPLKQKYWFFYAFNLVVPNVLLFSTLVKIKA